MAKVGTEVVVRAMGWGADGADVKPVSAADPLPVTFSATDAESSGLATEAKQDNQITQETAAAAVLGTTAGAKVVTDAAGTIQQYLRGIVAFFANALGAGTAAAAHRVTLASDDPGVATLGATTGAAVITDANGTVQQYTRGNIVLTLLTNAVLGVTSGAAVVTDANGTIQQYLRGIVVRILSFIGPQTAAASLSVTPSADQNPIFDHANGTKTAVTASATIITTGAGHTFLRITTDVDIVVNTAGAAAVDDGTASRIVANVPEVIPVPPSTVIKALSLAGSATVRCTPLKVR